jgi:hypothetical protein
MYVAEHILKRAAQNNYSMWATQECSDKVASKENNCSKSPYIYDTDWFKHVLEKKYKLRTCSSEKLNFLAISYIKAFTWRHKHTNVAS